ncbi:MAG: glycosyltransferase, partial [Pseudomonadota bacterium]
MASSKRVFFVNRFYYPDFSATAQILTDVAEGLADHGWEVHIVTSRRTYDGDAPGFKPTEEINGVTVHRVYTASFGGKGILSRVLIYLSFYLCSVLSVLKHVRKGDVVVSKTDPPILGGPIGLMAKLKGAKRVNWLQDIYPEVAEALGVKLAGSVTGAMMRGIRDRALSKASKTVVIGDCMADRVGTRGIAAEDIVLLQNFTDDEAIQPLSKS